MNMPKNHVLRVLVAFLLIMSLGLGATAANAHYCIHYIFITYFTYIIILNLF